MAAMSEAPLGAVPVEPLDWKVVIVRWIDAADAELRTLRTIRAERDKAAVRIAELERHLDACGRVGGEYAQRADALAAQLAEVRALLEEMDEEESGQLILARLHRVLEKKP